MTDESLPKPSHKPEAIDKGAKDDGRNAKDEANALAWHRLNVDPEENRETTPPNEELVSCPSVFIAEAYLPSHANRLTKALAALGWNEGGVALEHYDVANWVRGSRGGLGGGWLNLGGISPADSPRSGTRTAMLPRGVTFAEGSLFQLSSTLTVLCMSFMLDEGLSTEADSAARKLYETTARSVGQLTIYESAANQKQDAVRNARRRLRRVGRDWIFANLPGAFSDLQRAEFPCFELTTTKDFVPFEQGYRPKPLDYRQVLGLTNDFEAYESEYLAGFSLLEGDYGDPPEVIRFAGRLEELLADPSAKMYGGEDGISRRLFHHCHRMLAIWGFRCLLKAYQEELRGLQDQILGDATAKDDTVAFLEKSLMHLTRLLANSRAATSDTKTIVIPWRYSHEVPVWMRANKELRKRDADDFVSRLREETIHRSTLLDAIEEQVRSTVSIKADLLAAKTNLNLQVKVIWMTVAALTLAAIGLGLAVWQVLRG